MEAVSEIGLNVVEVAKNATNGAIEAAGAEPVGKADGRDAQGAEDEAGLNGEGHLGRGPGFASPPCPHHVESVRPTLGGNA